MKIVKYKGWNCRVQTANYAEGDRLALQLVDADTGERIATATVNAPEIPLKQNEILLKGWSENTGLPEVLEEAGIVRLTGREVPMSQWANALVAEYLGG
jgi:hypothetical protein